VSGCPLCAKSGHPLIKPARHWNGPISDDSSDVW